MRVLIVDDNAIVRMGLNRVLDRIESVDVVAEAGDGVEAIEVAAAFAPDIVLLDVRMPRMDGLEALPRLASAAKVIMLTSADDAETITAAISAGACGYLVHGNLGVDQVATAITTCYQGGLVLGPEARAQVSVGAARPAERPNPLRDLLTPREAEVLEAAARGLSNREIAEEQFLAPRTVKNYLNSAYPKLQVHNRAEAIVAWHDAVAD